jgi:hypothetical protein
MLHVWKQPSGRSHAQGYAIAEAGVNEQLEF